MRRYLSLWAEFFLLSWRRRPLLTAAALAAIAGDVLALAGCALALRAASASRRTGPCSVSPHHGTTAATRTIATAAAPSGARIAAGQDADAGRQAITATTAAASSAATR